MGRAVARPPQVGEKFRVVAPGGVVVREKVLPTSAHAGDLRKGETVTVLEAKVSEEVPGFPVVRIRIDVRVPLRAPVAGWVPLTEAGGKELFQKVGASSSGSRSGGTNRGASPSEKKAHASALQMPSVGEKFRVVAPGGVVVREKVLPTSAHAGDLRKGETVTVLEAKVSEEVPGFPVVRIRIDVRVPLRAPVAGWVPLTEAGGKELFQKVGASSSGSRSGGTNRGASPSEKKAHASALQMPSVGEKFRVVAPGGVVVREKVLPTSAHAGDLRKGETVTVLEAKVSEEVPGFPVVRIRIDVRVPLRAPVAGWVPLTEAGGKELFQKVGASSSGSRSGNSAGQRSKASALPELELPSVGEVFRVVAPSGAVVRKGILTTTSQCGSLQRGESVSVMEAHRSEEIPGHSAVRIRVDVRVPLRPHVAGWVSLVEPGGKEILRQVGAPVAAEPKDGETTNEKELTEVPEVPAVGSKFKVIVPVVVARKSELSTSSQTGNLQRGETVTVLEARLNTEVPGRSPIVKIRIDVQVPLRPRVTGWVPMTQDGKVLLQPTGLPKSTTGAANTSTSGGSRVEDNTSPATKMMLPDPGTKFKVVAPTVVVRKSFLTTSSQSGTLQKFEQVVCLEAKASEEIPGSPVVKIRINVNVPLRAPVAGWVPLTAGGKMLLQEVSSVTKQLSSSNKPAEARGEAAERSAASSTSASPVGPQSPQDDDGTRKQRSQPMAEAAEDETAARTELQPEPELEPEPESIEDSISVLRTELEALKRKSIEKRARSDGVSEELIQAALAQKKSAKADLIVHIVTLHEKALKKAARKKAKQEAKAAAAAEAARLQAEKQAAFAAKRKAQEQAERARQEREAAAEAARIAAEEEARRLAEQQAKERERLAAEKEANRRAALTGPRATLGGLIAATGADRTELLQLDDVDFKWLIQTQREALVTISAADERHIRSDLLLRRETEVRAEEARQAALDAEACRQRRAYRQEVDGLDFDLKILTGGSANSRLIGDLAPSDADEATRQHRNKEEVLHAMERAHAKAIAATEVDNPHRDDYTSRWGVLVGSGDDTRSWLIKKHNKEREKLLASFAEHEEASSIADTAGLRVTLMKMCSARSLSTAGQLQDLQQRLRKWHAAREEPIADRPEDQSKWKLKGRREDLLGSLIAIDGSAAAAVTDSAAGSACKTNLVVRMWLESPKLLLSAYVGAIAQHDVAGGRIRTMADLKRLGEPEGEVHLDQLMSVTGMKKAEGKRFRRQLMQLRLFDEELKSLGLPLGSTKAQVESLLEQQRQEKAAAEARELAEADSDVASVYLERRIVQACRAGDVDAGLSALKEMLETGVAAAPTEAAMSALIIALCDIPNARGLKKAFKLLRYAATTPEMTAESLPNSAAVVCFLNTMLQAHPDQGALDAAQELLVSMHEKGWLGLTKEVKQGVRAIKKQLAAAVAPIADELMAVPKVSDEEETKPSSTSPAPPPTSPPTAAPAALVQASTPPAPPPVHPAPLASTPATSPSLALVVTRSYDDQSSSSSSFEQDWSDSD